VFCVYFFSCVKNISHLLYHSPVLSIYLIIKFIDPTTGRPDHGGRDRHVAFSISNLDPLIASLDEKKITFTMSMSGRRALFCRDLDGNAFEFMEDKNIQ
jgi:hypothetical protein